jgi:hypothetical protein
VRLRMLLLTQRTKMVGRLELEAEANAAEKAFCDQGLSEATLIEPSSRIVVGVAAQMHLFLPTVPRLCASWPAAGGVTVGGMPRRRRRPPGHSLGLGRPPGLRRGVLVDGGPAVGRLPEVLTVLALLARTMAATAAGVARTAGPRCASTLRLTVGLSARGRHNLRRRKRLCTLLYRCMVVEGRPGVVVVVPPPWMGHPHPPPLPRPRRSLLQWSCHKTRRTWCKRCDGSWRGRLENALGGCGCCGQGHHRAALSRGAVTRGMTGLRSAVALGGAACQLWQQGQWQKLRSMKTLPRVVEVVRQSLHGHKLLTCHRVKQNTVRLLPRLLVAAARLAQPALAARSDPGKRLTKTQLRSMETLPDDLHHTRDVSK